MEYVEVEVEEFEFLAYTLYLPTAGQDEDFLEVLSQFSADIMLHQHNSSAIYIGTDSNHSEKSSKRRKEGMSDFMKSFSLKTILTNDVATFHHNNQSSSSQIDHILYSENSSFCIDLLDHLCNQEDSDNLSAHDVIIGKIKVPQPISSKYQKDYSHTYEPFLISKPIWEMQYVENYQDMVKEAFIGIFESFKSPEFIPALSEMCSKALVLSAEMCFKTTNPKSYHKVREVPRFSPDMIQAYNEHEKNCKKWRAAGRPSSNTHPLKLLKLSSQRNLQRLTRKETSEKAIKLHEELMQCKSSDLSKACKKLKAMRGDNKQQNDISFIETLCGKFEGVNVLEGFCANTELLCNREQTDENDHEFLRLCQADNEIIIELSKDDDIEIPHMNLTILKEIIFRRLKLNKACDLFKLTVEHLRFIGDENLKFILRLLNLIIDNLNAISAPQLNTAIATVVHKGKSKPVYNHKSYRQVRVSPLIGRLLDEYLRSVKVAMTKPLQNLNQYGFTENMNFLLGALQRHEAENIVLTIN